MRDNATEGKTRRGFLSALGATGAALGVGRIARADRRQVATSYLLDGRTAAWVGREPESIADTNNPTLNLEAGRTYEITWVNVDGQPHNVAIITGDGEVAVRTEIISEQGATQSVQFTASPGMSTYLCQVHPTSMVGDVVVEGGQQAQAQTTPANGTDGNRTRVGAQETTTAAGGVQTPTATVRADGNRTRVGAQETTTVPGDGTTAAGDGAQNRTTVPNPTAAPVEETTHPLADQFGENPVKFGADLRPAPGVETDADGRVWFTLHPPNGAQATLMYSVHLENAENVTSVRIRLDRPGDPVVAQLFRPDSPADVVEGTLVDSQLTAGDLAGPFQNGSLLRLTEAIRNDNAYVVVGTQQRPEGLLRGRIQPVEEAGTVLAPTRTETVTGDATTETATGTPTEAATGNATTPGTDGGAEANGVDSADVAQQAQQVGAPGFGALSTLGGLGGLAAYLYSRAGDDD